MIRKALNGTHAAGDDGESPRSATARALQQVQRITSWPVGSLASGGPGGSTLIQRLRGEDKPVPPPLPGALRVLSLNIAHGRRRAPHQALLPRRIVEANLGEIAATSERWQADVLAFQEADGPSAWSGNFDHVATLANLIGAENHFRGDHNPFRVGDINLASGTALVTPLELEAPFSHPFEMSWRDTKGFVAGTLRVPEWNDAEIDIASVHLDFLAPHIRRKQIGQMIDRLRHRSRPLVLLGDLNSCYRHERKTIEMLADNLDLRAYQPESELPTYPTYLPRRRLDWILVSPELEFAGYHTVPARLSDHLGVVADLCPR